MKNDTPVKEDRVRAALSKLAAARRAANRSALPQPSQRLEPCCPFDTYLDERIKKLEDDVKEARSRSNSLLMLLAGAVLTQIILRLVGV